MSWRVVPEEFLISVLSALSIKYTPKIYMWGSTMLAGNEAGFWHFPGCHFGEDLQETLPSVSGVLVRDPAASHYSPLPGGDAPRGTIPRKSLCEHLLVKALKPKCKQLGQCEYNICSAGAFDSLNELCKGISIIFLTGRTYVIWTLSPSSPPCQITILHSPCGSCRRSSRRKINARLLPCQQGTVLKTL